MLADVPPVAFVHVGYRGEQAALPNWGAYANVRVMVQRNANAYLVLQAPPPWEGHDVERWAQSVHVAPRAEPADVLAEIRAKFARNGPDMVVLDEARANSIATITAVLNHLPAELRGRVGLYVVGGPSVRYQAFPAFVNAMRRARVRVGVETYITPALTNQPARLARTMAARRANLGWLVKQGVAAAPVVGVASLRSRADVRRVMAATARTWPALARQGRIGAWSFGTKRQVAAYAVAHEFVRQSGVHRGVR